MRRGHARLAVTLATVLATALPTMSLTGCVPPSVDLRDRLCPCGPGWTCVAERCVSDSELLDAGARDAGSFDSGAIDDGAMDGGAIDDGAMDAMPDATPTDGATSDAPVGADAGMLASECDGRFAGAVLCDGFESGAGPWVDTLLRSGTALSTTARAQRGRSSLHARTTATNGQAALESGVFGPFTDGHVWARASIYLPASAIADDFTFMYTTEGVAPFEGISLGIGGGNAGAFSTLTGTYVSSDTLLVPRDRWVCFELHIDVRPDATGTIEIYMDGVRGASMTGLRTQPGAGYRYFIAGIDYTDPAQPALELYLDEVVYSRTRFPCP